MIREWAWSELCVGQDLPGFNRPPMSKEVASRLYHLAQIGQMGRNIGA